MYRTWSYFYKDSSSTGVHFIRQKKKNYSHPPSEAENRWWKERKQRSNKMKFLWNSANIYNMKVMKILKIQTTMKTKYTNDKYILLSGEEHRDFSRWISFVTLFFHNNILTCYSSLPPSLSPSFLVFKENIFKEMSIFWPHTWSLKCCTTGSLSFSQLLTLPPKLTSIVLWENQSISPMLLCEPLKL